MSGPIEYAEAWLKANPVRGVTVADVRAVLDAGRQASLGLGDTLFQEGAPSKAIAFLLAGEIRVTRRDPLSRRARELARVKGPAMVGHMGVTDGSPRSATCVALTDCDIVLLDSERVLALIDENTPRGTGLRRMLLTSLSRQQAAANRQVDSLVSQGDQAARDAARRRKQDEQDTGEILAIAGVLDGWKVDTRGVDDLKTTFDDEQRRNPARRT